MTDKTREEFECWFNEYNDEFRLESKDREFMLLAWKA